MSDKNLDKLNVERGLISKLIETRDIETITTLDIDTRFFTGEHRRVFSYITKFVLENGEVPTPRVVKKNFPNYIIERYYNDDRGEKIYGTAEPLDYWCSEIRRKLKHNTLAEMIEKAGETLGEFDTEEAYKQIKKAISYVDSEVEITKSVDITDGTDKRKELYEKKKLNHGIVGLETGILPLDRILRGLPDETLTMIIATTGVGKTFMQVLIGAYLALEGYKVQHFITEMSDNQMRDRYEMMLYSMTVGHISYKQFKEGKLPFKQEKSYYEFLDEILPDITPVILTPAKGVLAMRADIEKEKPDLVMIDGVYLMQDDQGAKDDWLRVAHITRDLKTASKDLHLPFLGNTQASQATSKKTGPGLDSIMYTQAIGQDCDNIIALWRDEVMYNEKEMGVKVLKQREGEQGQFIMTWDFDTMTFKPIYSVDQDGNSNPEEDEDAEDALLD